MACSFCDQHRAYVRKLIAGNASYICDVCIDLCHEMVHERVARAPDPDPSAMADAFADAVVGQAEARRALVAALRQYELRRFAPERAGLRPPRVLLVGPRGSGKTTLGRALCARASGPCLATDVNRLHRTGHPGERVEDLLRALFQGSTSAPDEGGALFLDNLDVSAYVDDTGDSHAEGVQVELLRLLDDTTLYLPVRLYGIGDVATVRVEGDRLLIVAAARLDADTLPDATDDPSLRQVLCDEGFLPAFVARFDRIVALSPPDPQELRAILTRGGGLLDQAAELVGRLGAKLNLGVSVDAMVRAAEGHPDGAWALERLVRRAIEDALLAAPLISYRA